MVPSQAVSYRHICRLVTLNGPSYIYVFIYAHVPSHIHVFIYAYVCMCYTSLDNNNKDKVMDLRDRYRERWEGKGVKMI